MGQGGLSIPVVLPRTPASADSSLSLLGVFIEVIKQELHQAAVVSKQAPATYNGPGLESNDHVKTKTSIMTKPAKPATAAVPATPARGRREPSEAKPWGPVIPENIRFPIIGIGASAGGLEALDLFLRNVPAKSGMAFVIVQHLNPTHKGIMVELLQRATGMSVL